MTVSALRFAQSPLLESDKGRALQRSGTHPENCNLVRGRPFLEVCVRWQVLQPLSDVTIMFRQQGEGRIRFGLLVLASFLRQQFTHESLTAE